MHISLAVISLGLLGLSRAQKKSIVTDLTFPAIVDPQPIVASVVKADQTETVLHLQCAEGTDETECGAPSITYTHIPPRIVAIEFQGDGEDEEGSVQYSLECKIPGASADCTKIIKSSQPDGGWSTMSSATTQVPTATFITTWRVTITAGLEKLEGVSATPAPSASAGATQTGSATQTDNAPPTTGTNAPSSSTSAGSAAMPLVTAAANWGVVGGAAVAAVALVL
ncbi:hypothetical protein HCBG_05670 [Histoplasma capsulatum G186AR]|uniref:GPI anchored protein n=2 Tax=Ajellomyces capsulatus TaxID=5037 RepID=C0NQ82_AJECG|nr:uncharacterized protein HCBG_05670 [Histoplasma capsulatum G186AR]EEH06354.1 hypothetical protein HCBG_05670 [Histoplasma capsulatum G186AR]KAG5293186.1 hypothetical protein I7I52_04415 [Histoplasma capsulatum]QSS74636.1 hypothetical protein I7I50_03508 [Histoplasma capsulatum G186AR]